MNRHLLMLSALMMLLPGPAGAVGPADFGYGSAQLPDHRAVLVIIADYATAPVATNVAGSPEEWQQFLFGADPALSMRNYMLENSNGLFSLNPARTLPVRVAMMAADSQAGILAANPGWNSGQVDVEYFGRVVKKAIDIPGFPFAIFDTNHNGVLECPGELTLVLINGFNDGTNAAGNFPFTQQQNGGQTFTVAGSVLGVGHKCTFATIAHEFGHSLGIPWELYTGGSPNGLVNEGMTIMSQTNFGSQGVEIVNDPSKYNPGRLHFDPWSKLRFGWTRPRIVEIRTGGRFDIPIATSKKVDAPIILYDPAKGFHEYFILEYRARSGDPTQYDANFAQASLGGTTAGLVIWQVATQNDHSSFPNNWAPTDPLLSSLLVPTVGLPAYSSSILCRCPPALGVFANEPWGSGTTTPVLRWFDGASTATRLRVLPLAAGADRITVEILAEYDTWVDFSSLGIPFVPELGTVDFPYNTFFEGKENVSYGGHLWIKPGHSAETVLNLSKPMTIHAAGNPVTIGQ